MSCKFSDTMICNSPFIWVSIAIQPTSWWSKRIIKLLLSEIEYVVCIESNFNPRCFRLIKGFSTSSLSLTVTICILVVILLVKIWTFYEIDLCWEYRGRNSLSDFIFQVLSSCYWSYCSGRITNVYNLLRGNLFHLLID